MSAAADRNERMPRNVIHIYYNRDVHAYRNERAKPIAMNGRT
jgi:hypothetical protein